MTPAVALRRVAAPQCRAAPSRLFDRTIQPSQPFGSIAGKRGKLRRRQLERRHAAALPSIV